ncbi:MAG: hypothetical protein D6729_13100, partial [Deltaproteobacteria bacterium]
GPHRLRRVAFRPLWHFDAGPLEAPGLCRLGTRWLVHGEDGLFALSRRQGRCAWQIGDTRAVWLGPRPSDGILVATGSNLDLVTPAGATAWSVPAPRGAYGGGHYVLGRGLVIAAFDGSRVEARRAADGARVWAFEPPGRGRSDLCGETGHLVAATAGGVLYGLDPRTGEVRWRIHSDLEATHPPLAVGPRIVLLGRSDEGPAAFLVDAATGRSGRIVPLPVDRLGREVVVWGGRLHLPATVSGEAALLLLRPSGTYTRLLPEGLFGVPVVWPARGRFFVSDAGGRVAALDGLGRRRWFHTLPPCELGTAPRLALSRGVLLAARDALFALSPECGEVWGRLALPGLLAAHLLRVSDDLSFVVADEEGVVHACRLATHLSVVTDT